MHYKLRKRAKTGGKHPENIRNNGYAGEKPCK